MGRSGRAFARIGAVYSVIGGLVWLLWPEDLSFADNPEAWLALLSAFVIWNFFEFQSIREVESERLSKNDIRVSRELVDLHANRMRYLLKDTDLWTFVRSDIYSDVGALCDRRERGIFFFHQEELDGELATFMKLLRDLSYKVAEDTVPVLIGGAFRTGYKPFELVSEEEYQERRKESKKANEMASKAWDKLDRMVSRIKSDYPEVFEDPIE